MTGIKEIKHCYRADKGNALLEPSLKVLFIKFGWGATFGFLEAEIISFCQRRQPFAFSAFYVHPLTFEGGSPSKFGYLCLIKPDCDRNTSF